MRLWSRKSKESDSPALEVLKGTDIWLVRHGDFNPERGGTLTEDGIWQAQLVGKKLAENGLITPSLIISSESKRCTQTAEQIAAVALPEMHPERSVVICNTYEAVSRFPEKYPVDEFMATIVNRSCEAAHTLPDYLEAVVFVGHEPIMSAMQRARMLSSRIGYGEAIPFEPGVLQHT